MTRPVLNEGDTISIGSSNRAVVCSIAGIERNVCEAVYLDNRGRAINEDVRWKGTTWEFVHSGPCGGYADQSTKMQLCKIQQRKLEWCKFLQCRFK